MKNPFNKFRKLLPIILLTVLAFPHCTTDEYDNFQDKLDLEFSFGGDSLSIPLIKSDKIYLSSLLEENTEFIEHEIDFTFNDTISGLSDLFNLLAQFTHGEIELIADVENSIPFRLALQTEALDENNVPNDNIDIKTTGAMEAGKMVGANFSPVTSRILFSIQVTESEELFVDKLRLFINLSQDDIVEKIPVTDELYFKFNLKLRIPKGLKIDPDNFDFDLDSDF